VKLWVSKKEALEVLQYVRFLKNNDRTPGIPEKYLPFVILKYGSYIHKLEKWNVNENKLHVY